MYLKIKWMPEKRLVLEGSNAIFTPFFCYWRIDIEKLRYLFSISNLQSQGYFFSNACQFIITVILGGAPLSILLRSFLRHLGESLFYLRRLRDV
jgi:hypothetical protein